jgi:hypothetical protein
MVRRSVLLLLTCVAVSAAAPRFVPTGVKIERSGFATILTVPVPDYRKTVQPRPKPHASIAAWYADENGIGEAEARKRMSEQQAMEPVFQRLVERLRKVEPDNFTGARLFHKPDWGYLLYFKRDPEATLAKYMRNPRFKAAQGRYTPQELDALTKPWLERFTKAGIIGVYGLSGTEGTAQFGMTVTEEEFRALAARQGWGPLPDAIKLGFGKEAEVPAIDPRAAPFVRAFANDTKATLMQPEAGASGRIILRDGCLRVTGGSGPGALAYFHHETGLGFDDKGYLALIDRRSGKPKGRIGEMFVWAGPNRLRENMPGLAELRAKCGDWPVDHVGNPESRSAFDIRNGRN